MGRAADGGWDTGACEDGSVCGGEVFGVKIGITGDETDATAAEIGKETVRWFDGK